MYKNILIVLFIDDGQNDFKELFFSTNSYSHIITTCLDKDIELRIRELNGIWLNGKMAKSLNGKLIFKNIFFNSNLISLTKRMRQKYD